MYRDREMCVGRTLLSAEYVQRMSGGIEDSLAVVQFEFGE